MEYAVEHAAPRAGACKHLLSKPFISCAIFFFVANSIFALHSKTFYFKRCQSFLISFSLQEIQFPY